MRKQTSIQLVQSLLSGIGLFWLFLEAYYALSNPDASNRIGFTCFIIIGLVIGLVWFFIDGYCITGFLKSSIEIRSNAIDSTITVMFGDLFAQDGHKAISVNEFFDSTVDDKHVSSNTLHGIMLKNYWAGNTADWDKQVAQELSGISPAETVNTRPAPGKHNRFPLGTTASVSMNGHNFLCVALANTDTKSLQASASSADLQCAVRGLLTKARSVCAGQPLNIPLVGNGLSRAGVKPNIIVDLLLLAIFEESKKSKITNHIRIVLHKSLKKNIDLINIQEDWK